MDNPAYTQSLNKLISEFAKLPGIGPKSAERIAFYVLKTRREEALELAKAISHVKNNIKQCSICFNLCEGNICPVCADKRRDRSIICVVEQPRDIISLEKTGMCKWVYHVLNGHIAPLEGVEAEDLTINELIKRVKTGKIKEVVMATNPNIEGDGTALHISSLIKELGVPVTRLARGLPTGSAIEYAGGNILADAIIARQKL